MIYLCEMIKTNGNIQGIRILECHSLDSLAVIPEEIHGFPVTELAPYLFSTHKNYEEQPFGQRFWWPEKSNNELPTLKGDRIEELRLSSNLIKIGAYAFYNCEKMKKIELYSTTLDWGTGVFTGCSGIEELTFHVNEDKKSCMHEILSELKQTLAVRYLGRQEARLIFSEFFEDAVENTPARILVTDTHGCGKQYRNAFVSTQFQFQEYDSLFPYVKAQESENLAVELALGRLMYPYHLTEKNRQTYLDYMKKHCVAAACQTVENQHTDELNWLLDHLSFERPQLEQVITVAMNYGNSMAVSCLMEKQRTYRVVKKQRFCL